MIIIDKIEAFNFEGAFRGMRNPLESWEDSDSDFKEGPFPVLGPKDLRLAQKLINAGSDHSKFMRQILVSMDIDAPLYWWKEADTYKVATVANSCSTMHTIARVPITLDLFSFDKETQDLFEGGDFNDLLIFIDTLETLRVSYLETGDKKYWRALIQMLPSGWNQKRTWTGNYSTARNIVFARDNHKLTEWHTFLDKIKELPYAEELIFLGK
jgi:hypothetical protein